MNKTELINLIIETIKEFKLKEQKSEPNQSQIKMLSPRKPGKERRNVNVNMDNKDEYTKKGYTYVGLSDKKKEATKQPDKTKKPKSTKKIKTNVSGIEGTIK
jgi:hypothetical protein